MGYPIFSPSFSFLGISLDDTLLFLMDDLDNDKFISPYSCRCVAYSYSICPSPSPLLY